MKYIVNQKAKVAQAEDETYIMLDDQYYVLNETARLIWQCFAKGATLEDVVGKLLLIYDGDVEKEQLRKDCVELFESMLACQMIQEAGNSGER